MNASWRTSAAAYTQLIIVIATTIGALIAGVDISPEQAGAVEGAAEDVGLSWPAQIVMGIGTIGVVLTNACGLMAARDNKVTSEQAGAKK